MRLATMSGASARARCTVSGLAVVAQFFIYLAWSTEWPETSNVAILCWLAALDVGFVSATYGLSAARSWRGKLVASGLLLVHSFSLLVLFFYAFSLKMSFFIQ
jgi:hypothetical protein